MKITKGKWITATIGSEHRVVTPRGHLTIARCGSGSEDRDNATFIAEAGTVHNETGYSPRQLAEQKKALLDVCKFIKSKAEPYTQSNCILYDITIAVSKAIAAATN